MHAVRLDSFSIPGASMAVGASAICRKNARVCAAAKGGGDAALHAINSNRPREERDAIAFA
jgi:hypothetical protein